MNEALQRICAWSGPVFMLLAVPGLWIMGFLPPLPAALDADAVAAHYEANRTGIRVGANVFMQMAVAMLLWSVVISLQIRRLEGAAPVLSIVQLICGVAANFGFVIMGVVWTVAAYRPERGADVVQAMNEIGWFFLVMPVSLLTVQAFAIGLAILSDPRPRPLFPRWVGYYNFWAGLLFLPGALATFFKTGPFAWDGILVFWLAVAVFGGWMLVMALAVDRAIQTSDAALGDAPAAPDAQADALAGPRA